MPKMDKSKLALLLVGKPEPKEPSPEEEARGYEESLAIAAQDLIDCVHEKDAEGVAEALHAAFMACDGMPHEEGEHPEEEGLPASEQD